MKFLSFLACSLFFFLFQLFPVFAYTDDELKGALANLYFEYYSKEGEISSSTANEIKHWAKIAKFHRESFVSVVQSLQQESNIQRKLPSGIDIPQFQEAVEDICTTTFCGPKDGITHGLNMVKSELQGGTLTTSDNLPRVVLGLVDFALPYAGLIAFLGLIYGGFLELTSVFGEDQGGKAKDIIKASAIGIIVILLAYSIVSTILNITG
jgi:hypothetical protein